MKRIAVINGPNLNLLGSREPQVYGSTTLADLDKLCVEWGAHLGVEISTFQSNHEGDVIDAIHRAAAGDGIVINPGALTHYSYAVHDALAAVDVPAVEVHISNVREREEWRRHSVVAPACVHTIYGRGISGYRWSIRHLVELAAWPVTSVAYGSDDDQVGDLRVPKTPPPHPVVIVIHGGFWRHAWTRDIMDAAAVDLSRRGWATWNLEYRRIGLGGGWPATLNDVAAAMDHVPRLADEHDLDASSVVVLGHSAGGQLALWAAGRHRLRGDDPGHNPKVRPIRAVGLAPVTDLAAGARDGIGRGAVEDFLRRTPAEGPDRYEAASPTGLLPLGVPQVIVHGDADDEVPVSMSLAYADAAAVAGDDVRLKILEGTDHYSIIEPRSAAWPAVVDAVGAPPA